ncbi:MAG: hypothetical protein K0Q77_2497, partial [Anaerosporomusa subterranea]|nr:hypothetical protein [Anaerosporomusa subterranea]
QNGGGELVVVGYSKGLRTICRINTYCYLNNQFYKTDNAMKLFVN